LSTPVENSEATWKKATKCNKYKFSSATLFLEGSQLKKLSNESRQPAAS
jgi:hypothetical protein